jgi:hypothetical protein
MEAVCSSVTSVAFQQTTWHYIPEDGILHNHRCENLKSYTTLPIHIFESLIFCLIVQAFRFIDL